MFGHILVGTIVHVLVGGIFKSFHLKMGHPMTVNKSGQEKSAKGDVTMIIDDKVDVTKLTMALNKC